MPLPTGADAHENNLRSQDITERKEMQIEAEYTIKLTAYEVIALSKSLGSMSENQKMEHGLTLGQAQIM
jgi:hypothetical protein